MSVIIHIGPPKTATTSLQNSVIPHLGLPFEIKPEWSRTLARAPVLDLPARTERDLIVSEEGLGDFTRLPPETVAERLARVFAQGAVVVYCVRNPLEQFYSLYRQRLVNGATLQADGRCLSDVLSPVSPEEYLRQQWDDHCARGLGFFASVDRDRVRTAFGRHFTFKTVDFGLLARGAQVFARAFADACGLSLHGDMSFDNVTSADALEAALAYLPAAAPSGLKDLYRRLFAARLPAAQEDFILAFRRAG